MNLYLKGYQGCFRLLRLEYGGYDIDAADVGLHDNIALVKDGTLSFSGRKYECSDIGRLPEGSICSLNEQGVLWQLFSPVENDATIYMTGHCNSNCVMCPTTKQERHHSEGMPIEMLECYIDLLPESLGHITVTGGEPTLRVGDFIRVITKLAQRFPEVETLILTNGRSLSATQLVNKMLIYCPRHMTVAIPLHSAKADIHDSITQVPGSFVETCRGIRNLLDHKVTVEIRIVISKFNLSGLENLVNLICSAFPETCVVNFISLETRGNCAKNAAEVYISPAESFKAAKAAIIRLVAFGIDVGLYNFPLCMVERGFWNLCSKSITPEKIRYDDKCEGCEAKSLCGGFFYSTLSLAKPKVRPICFHGGKTC